jgi:hypothetical protein
MNSQKYLEDIYRSCFAFKQIEDEHVRVIPTGQFELIDYNRGILLLTVSWEKFGYEDGEVREVNELQIGITNIDDMS